MSEEIRKTGAEINDAAPENAGGIENTPPQLSDAELANVSGAGDEDPMAEYAKVSCRMCGSSKANYICDGGSPAKLLAYMRKHGKIDYLDCPYRKKVPNNFKPIKFN